MNRCPKCHRFGIKYNEGSKTEVCIWRDCLWVNKNCIDLNNYIHPILFQKFIDTVQRKI